MQRLKTRVGQVATRMVSLLIIGTALVVFISLAMNQRPFGVSTALLAAEHSAGRARPGPTDHWSWRSTRFQRS